MNGSAMSRLKNEAALKGIQDHWLVVRNLCEYLPSKNECPDWYKFRLHQLIKSAIMIYYRASEKDTLKKTFKEGLLNLIQTYPVLLSSWQFYLAANIPQIYLLLLMVYLKCYKIK